MRLLVVILAAMTLAVAAVSAAQVGTDTPPDDNEDQVGDRLRALNREDQRRWPGLTPAIWALADPNIPADDLLGVESRVRNALMGPQPRGEVVGALTRALTSSAAFFRSRECDDVDDCVRYRRATEAFTELGRDLGTWWNSGSADLIINLTRIAAEGHAAGRDVDRWEKQRAHAIAQRERGIDGPTSLRRLAATLRADGQNLRAWRLETLAKALADHPEEPLPSSAP